MIDSYTKSLLHFTGANNSQAFVDEVAGNTWAADGSDGYITTSKYKFSPSCLYCPAPGGIYLTSGIANFYFNNANFTIDFWVNRETNNNYDYAFGNTLGDEASVGLGNGGINQAWNFSYQIGASGYSISADTVLQVNTWYHLAVVRSGGNLYLFTNGILENSRSDLGTSSLKNFTNVNIKENTPSQSCWIDEFRYSYGIARWISDFTPPIYPYGKVAQQKIIMIGD